MSTTQQPENARREGERVVLMPKHVSPPRMEAWLWIMLSSFIPIVLMAFVPEEGRVPLIVLAAAPLAIGLGILIVKHWPANHPGQERDRWTT